METVNVDATGVGLTDGGDYHLRASRKSVRAGLMVNYDVMIRYPDGQVGKGTRVMVTPKGIDHFKRTMPLADRVMEGRA